MYKKEKTIKDKLEAACENILGDTMELIGVSSGDVTPQQALELDECYSKIADIFRQILKQNS